ncbi:hypothetical protein [Amycolatopsis speibonae]|uniref:Uncharacterized protein n=1 Tax=Amycolatopsis speibonae TaxID=1450224 RepID=A0ABV7NYQ1_9PSEU
MSEYQYYEFLAIDSPLDERQQAALVYVSNWGTRRLMFRLPRHVLDLDTVEDYRVGHHLSAWTADEFLVLDMTSEDESDDFEFNYEAEARLSATVGVRTELAAGDLRPLYLAWLAGYGDWERDENAFEPDADQSLEPLVPPGLATLTAPQRAFADFLRLDDELLASAARTSPPFAGAADDQMMAWIKKLPLAEKNELLARVVREPGTTVRMELLRRFRDIHTTATAAPRRTVADLLDNAARLRTEKV